jgi:hypothetical protein
MTVRPSNIFPIGSVLDIQNCKYNGVTSYGGDGESKRVGAADGSCLVRIGRQATSGR